MSFRQHFLPALICCILIALPANHLFAQSRLITMGTGSTAGTYYKVGLTIGNLINTQLIPDGYRCAVETTSGSRYNLNAVAGRELDLGIVQSDVQYMAVKGEGAFAKKGETKNIRSLFSLMPEAVYLITRKDSGIETLDDLKGKKFSMGRPGSGQFETMRTLLQALNWKPDVFLKTKRLKPEQFPAALCSSEIDAFVMTLASHNQLIAGLAAKCPVSFLELGGPAIDQMITDHPYYTQQTIAGNVYEGIAEDTRTYGVTASLITNAALPEDIAYTLVKSVFEKLEELKKSHPALENLQPADMIKTGLSAPLHPGAVKFYKEAGLL